MAKMDVPLIAFLGTPIIALAVAVILGVILLAQAGKMSEFYNMTNETLMVVGPILFVTAAGGVLGKVISVSGMVQFITEHSNVLEDGRNLLPVPSRRDTQDGSGLVHGRAHDDRGYARPRASGPRPRHSGAFRPLRNRYRRGRDDRLARERLLLLGRHELRRDEG